MIDSTPRSNLYSSGTPEVNFARWLASFDGGKAPHPEAFLYATLMRADTYGMVRLGIIELDSDFTYITRRGVEALDAYNKDSQKNQ